MTTTAHLLATGPGWRVSDVHCTAGPNDRPFEELHESVCIAAVTRGTFRYRTSQGAALLAPGAVLLGNPRHGFECSHEHGISDRCLSFHFAPELFDAVLDAVQGARRPSFAVPRLPPSAALTPWLAAAEASRDDGDGAALEELALGLAGAVATTLAEAGPPMPAPSRRDERRISDALHRIEAEAEEPLALADLARGAAMSPYHFLRTFAAVVGTTPHQYVLGRRLHRAAARLRGSSESVSAIAFDAGFSDLSTFNRRFRRVTGLSPSAWRARRASR